MALVPPVQPNTSYRKIKEIAIELGLDPETILPHGHYIAKIPLEELRKKNGNPPGNLILVTAMSPTPQGEGKTTTSIGIADALRVLGKRRALCLREPSLGPYFGIKGGGTGAGLSKVVPSEAINLHFVGDMYSIEKANNLLAAMLDNHLQHGNELRIDPRRIVLKRVIDLNDRALREIFIGLGGVKHGVPRKDGFSITTACEVMAILCLTSDFFDLGKRLGDMVVAFTYEGTPVRARDINAVGAMQVLLRDAINPNIVQTMEGTPAFVHGGPFANVAHGTSSLISAKTALHCADYVVTEAGFGTDLGGEKFFDIACLIGGIKPASVVIVATVKAVAYHGGFTAQGGLGNLAKHIENMRLFGLEPMVAINKFDTDKPAEIKKIIDFCDKLDIEAVATDNFSRGGKGATQCAEAVLRNVTKNKKKKIKFLYSLNQTIPEKLEIIAKKIYGADGVDLDSTAKADVELMVKHAYDKLPVCVAKTPLSLSDNAKLRGLPRNFRITVNELRISAGAGFVVAICGNIMTMPGLPKVPAAARIKILPDGTAVGLT